MNHEEKIAEMETAIAADYSNIAGMVVLKAGKAVYENYFGICTRENHLHVFSVTKSIVSILFGIAMDKGYLDSIDRKVLEFFPEYTVKRGEKTIQYITIRDMLTMTAPYKYKSNPYPYTFDVACVKNWISKNIERYHVFGFGLWAVCLKSTGEMIGDCGLTMQNIGDTILSEIGYHIAKAHQHQGYVREAAQVVRDWAFTHATFGLVYSYMKKANIPSSATARANGMTLLNEFIDDEGEQTVVYGISREEWQNQKISKEIGK